MLAGTTNPQGYGRLNDSLDEVPRGQPIDIHQQQQQQDLSAYHQSQNNTLQQPSQQTDALIQQQQALLSQQQPSSSSSQPLSLPAQQNYFPQPFFQQVQQPQHQPSYQYPPATQQQQQFMVQVPIMSNAGHYPHQGMHPQGGQQLSQQQMLAPSQAFIPSNLQQGSLKIPSRRTSEQFYCDACKRTVNSKVIFKNGSGTYLAGTIIGLCGLWLGCCLIPCALDDCKDAQHICSNCGVNIGAKRFLFD